jgi:hypothetical protein
MLLLALAACARRSPPDEAWELLLHGQVVGVQRSWWSPGRVVRERLLRVAADGRTHDQHTTVTLSLAADGAVASWTVTRPERTTTGSGPAWDAWSVLPAASGRLPLVDEASGGLVERDVVRTGDLLSWDTAAGPVLVALEGGRPVSGTWAGTAFRRASPEVADPEATDVAALLSRPAPAFPDARRSVVSEWTVGGEAVRVDVPLALELPPWAAAVGALARRVAAELPDAAAPFGAEGAGDCTEHTQRFLVEAADAGWEVRPVAGWLYLAEPTPRLWLHAWAEVRVGERWVAVDPTLGQFPADAGHLPIGSSTVDVARLDGVDVTLRDLR